MGTWVPGTGSGHQAWGQAPYSLSRPTSPSIFRMHVNCSVPHKTLKLCSLSTPVLPPLSPSLVAPRFLEVGSERPVSCTLDGLFPAPEAEVSLSLGEERLHPDVTLDGDSLVATATATASAEQEGTRQLLCSVTLGGESREAQENLTVYSKGNGGGGVNGWGRGPAKAEPGKGVGLHVGTGRAGESRKLPRSRWGCYLRGVASEPHPTLRPQTSPSLF